ncbi:MAG: FAD-dependent monooxygenase [Pseudomonadota bacterium]
MTKEIDIAIIGGGIAGLSAAIAIEKAGLTAQVFEAAPVIQPLGTSLSLWPNAMTCLTDWGCDVPIRESGHRIGGLAWRRPDGRPYFARDLDDLYDEAGDTGYCIRRADLHDHLLMSLDPSVINLGQRLDQIKPDGDGVILSFAAGEPVRARHVIGADGAWSALRNSVLADGDPTYSGYGAWLGLSSAPAPYDQGDEGCEYIGRKDRLGIFETGTNTRYWFTVANAAKPTAHARSANLQEPLTRLQDWPKALTDVVKGSQDGTVIYVSFYDRPIAKTWGKGPITLIGDAMHPFVPNLGQGACQAIEDAWVLGLGLEQGHQGDALNAWMHRNRHSRLKYMHKTAQKVGTLAQSANPMMRASLNLLGLPPMTRTTTNDLRRQFTRVKPA